MIKEYFWNILWNQKEVHTTNELNWNANTPRKRVLHKNQLFLFFEITDYDDGLETTTFVSSDQTNAFDIEIEEKSSRIPVSVCSTPCPIGEIKIQNEVRPA